MSGKRKSLKSRRKRNRPGGQEGNRNALKHGCYSAITGSKVDGRTRAARALAEIEATLAAALGEPSPQEALIIQRASVKAVRCSQAERAILRGKASDDLLDSYLRWARELRSDLQALGLEARARKVVDLGDYVKERYGA